MDVYFHKDLNMNKEYHIWFYDLKNQTKINTLMAKFNTTSLTESIKVGNVQLICSEVETFEQLKEQFKQGETVEFTIYIK